MFKINIPYLLGVQDTPNNSQGFPNIVEFKLNICNDTGRFYQTPSQNVDNLNQMAYSLGSLLGTAMDDTVLGFRYAANFHEFIANNLELQNKTALEIGCGRGFLLKLLKKNKCIAEGIEPGSQNSKFWKKYNVNVVNKSFPSEGITKKYDIIIGFLLLEHIKNIKEFFFQLKSIKKPGACIVLAVPDCEKYIDSGDIGMLIHQHYHYFTKKSLKSTLLYYGYKIKITKKSNCGGLVYVIAEESDTCSHALLTSKNDESFSSFNRAYNEFLDRLKTIFNNKLSLGIYCPARIINVFSQLDCYSSLRFFDDDRELHRRYYPNFDYPVESFDDLKLNPTDKILIASRTFKEMIFEKIMRQTKLKQEDILFI